MGAAWTTLGFGLQRVIDQEATTYLPEWKRSVSATRASSR
jgi:hypothetical protein